MNSLRCRGAVAIEAAMTMLLLVPLLVAGLYFGRLALAVTALEQAAANAARYMATRPDEDLHDQVRVTAALKAARRIFDDTLAAANVPTRDLYVWFSCDPGDCRTLPPGYRPIKVGVYAGFNFPNADLFPYYMYERYEYTWIEGRAEVGREK